MNAHTESSLRFLLRIYEQEKDWEKAIVAAGKLEAYSKRSMKPVIAQYYCELAELRITAKKYSDAKSYLKSARSADARCVRESMLRGYLAMELHEYREAIRHYLRAKKKNIHYLSEIIQQLTICYEKCADEQAYVLFLQESIAESPCYAVIFALSEHYKQKNGIEFAISFVVEQLKHRPSSRGLSYLTSLYLLILNEKSSEPLQTLLSLMYGLIAEKPLYQCTQCGFSCKELFWLCPSCHGWNSISPSI
jgi:lipopolysaccharide assembly protein B